MKKLLAVLAILAFTSVVYAGALVTRPVSGRSLGFTYTETIGDVGTSGAIHTHIQYEPRTEDGFIEVAP